MPLRPLLAHLEEDPAAQALAREGGRAFVSSSLRPYADRGADRRRSRPRAGAATLIVVGDDRAARDLAADLRAWLAPRRVRYYPSRGVAYESHLAPPPHLVGLRVAALDSLLGDGGPADATAEEEGRPVVVVSAVALSEKVPDPALRPHSFTLRVGELLDLDECAARARRSGLRARRPGRGARAVRDARRPARRVPGDRGARRARRHVRRRDRVAALVLDVHAALARRGTRRSRSRRRPSWPPSTASWPRSPPPTGAFARATARTGERPDIAELLPVERFGALLDLIGDDTRAARGGRGGARAGARRPLERRLRGVRRRGRAPPLREPRERRNRRWPSATQIWLSALSADQPIELRAQAADTAARSLAEAEPELEKLVRSGYRTVVTFPRRGEGERAAYNLGRVKASWLGEGVDAGRTAASSPRCASRRLRCARASSRRR